MKAFVSILLLSLFAITAQAQSLADVARAERKRQRSVESRKVVVEVGELTLAPPSRPAAVAEIEQPKAEPQKAEQAPAAQPAATDGRKSADDAFQSEWNELSKKRSELLVKLGTVIRDREAARKIEEELQQIQKRAAELKVKQEAVPR